MKNGTVVVIGGMRRVVDPYKIYQGTMFDDYCVHATLLSLPCKECWKETSRPPVLKAGLVIASAMQAILWAVIGCIVSFIVVVGLGAGLGGEEIGPEGWYVIKAVVIAGTLAGGFYGWRR